MASVPDQKRHVMTPDRVSPVGRCQAGLGNYVGDVAGIRVWFSATPVARVEKGGGDLATAAQG